MYVSYFFACLYIDVLTQGWAGGKVRNQESASQGKLQSQKGKQDREDAQRAALGGGTPQLGKHCGSGEGSGRKQPGLLEFLPMEQIRREMHLNASPSSLPWQAAQQSLEGPELWGTRSTVCKSCWPRDMLIVLMGPTGDRGQWGWCQQKLPLSFPQVCLTPWYQSCRLLPPQDRWAPNR